MIEIAAVNVGTPTPLATIRDENIWSGIRKAPVAPTAVLWLSEVNLSGDGQADLSVHGGVDKAVYAYPSEHLPRARRARTRTSGPAAFGENLSTIGALEDAVPSATSGPGATTLLQVTQPRWPCYKLALHRRRPDIQALLRGPAAPAGTSGCWNRARCPPPGRSRSPRRDPASISVRDAHLAMRDVHLLEPDRIRSVADHPALAEQWRAPMLERLKV